MTQLSQSEIFHVGFALRSEYNRLTGEIVQALYRAEFTKTPLDPVYASVMNSCIEDISAAHLKLTGSTVDRS